MLSRASINAPVGMSDEGQKIFAAIVSHFEALNKTGSLQIEGATLDNTPIGQVTAAAATFTDILSTTAGIAGLAVTVGSTFPVTSSTPAVTSGSGTLTTASSTVNITKVGDRRLCNGVVTITTNGTGATDIRLSLPESAADVVAPGCGVDSSSAGLAVFVTGSQLRIRTSAGAYPGGSGVTLYFSVTYRV